MSDPQNPVPAQDAMEIQFLIVPDEAKPWFVEVLNYYGFDKIAAAITEDDSEAWFSKMFLGCLQCLGQTTAILEQIRQARARVGTAQSAQVAVVEQDRRIVTPGDKDFQD